jgi:hypothetical protein
MDEFPRCVRAHDTTRNLIGKASMQTRNVSAVVIAVACFAALAAHSVRAGESPNVTIVHIQLNKSYPNVAFIKLSATPTGRPACSVHSWHYSLPLSNAFEAQMYAAILAAYSSGSVVDISGKNLCEEHGQIESLHAVGLHTP